MDETFEYTCAICHKTFMTTKEWDNEAVAELKETFGADRGIHDSDVVCEDCYEKVMFFFGFIFS